MKTILDTTMKLKNLLVVLFAMFTTAAFSQQTTKSCYVKGDSCYTVTCTNTCQCSGLHPVFNIPEGATPKQLPRLGTNPQFGTLRNYTTTQQVYDHLQNRYKTVSADATELDLLWRAMGYNGFSDASFTVDKLTPVYYKAGVTGMLGAGGHTYVYAQISKGQDIMLKGYQVTAMSGCDVTIMEICGNAFFTTCADQGCVTTACKLDVPGGTDGKSVYSFYRDGQCMVRVCDRPAKQEATQRVSTLAHNQQFGNMTQLQTPQEVYDYLNKLYAENQKGNAAELDRLMKSIGYTDGLKDSRLDASAISIINYEGGVAATMGGGEHQYMYSEISGENYDNIRGYQIRAINDNCDLTIIDVCGNALYCPQPLNCKTYPCGCD